VWDANELRNSNRYHLFSCIPLSLLKVCISAKSAMIQIGKPTYIVALRG
jgi:hypothetical protein